MVGLGLLLLGVATIIRPRWVRARRIDAIVRERARDNGTTMRRKEYLEDARARAIRECFDERGIVPNARDFELGCGPDVVVEDDYSRTGAVWITAGSYLIRNQKPVCLVIPESLDEESRMMADSCPSS